MNPFRASDPVVQSARSYARQLTAELELYGLRVPSALLTASPTWDDIFSAVGVLLANVREPALMAIAPFIYARYADIAAAMDSTEETARANVHQGLKKLRKGWDDATD